MQNNWISCKEDLPNEGEYILIYTTSECIATAYLRRDDYDKEYYWELAYGYDDYCWLFEQVSHWMPLPKRPIK